MGRGLSVTLNSASKVNTYIKWYIGKAINIPNMKHGLTHCMKVLEEYKTACKGGDDYPIRRVTLS